MMGQPHNTLSEWEFGIYCLRAEVVSGRKLSPAEMVAAVDDASSSDDALPMAMGALE